MAPTGPLRPPNALEVIASGLDTSPNTPFLISAAPAILTYATFLKRVCFRKLIKDEVIARDVDKVRPLPVAVCHSVPLNNARTPTCFSKQEFSISSGSFC